jgi:hypothetical protein
VSLILDALNRSRQDTGQLPGLETLHYSEDRSRPVPVFAWVLAGALVLAVSVIVWLVLERGGSSAGGAISVPPAKQAPVADTVLPPTAAALTQAPAQPTAGDKPAPIKATASRAPATTSPEEPAAATIVSGPPPEALPGPAPLPSSDPPALAGTEPLVNKTADASVDALYRQQQQAGAAAPASPAAPLETSEPAPAVAASREESPVDIEKLLVAAEQELADARLAEHPAPFIAALSQQTKDAIPTLMYQRHDYSSSGKSSVVINGKTLGNGASTAGVKVVEILPDSVVLSFAGTQFRLRALNSWVNL